MDIIQIHPYPARPRRRAVKTQETSFCDGFERTRKKPSFFSYKNIAHNKEQVVQTRLGGRRGSYRTKQFVTEDSRLYLSQNIAQAERHGLGYIDARRRLDGVHVRFTQSFSPQEQLFISISSQFATVRSQLAHLKRLRTWNLSGVRMWQMSMACAMVFGMITISMIYKNLGQSAQARGDATNSALTKDPVVAVVEAQNEEVYKRLPIEDKVYSEAEIAAQEERESVRIAKDLQEASRAQKEREQEERLQLVQEKVLLQESADEEAFAVRAAEMVKGYPIENMLPEILELDREVAIYMIAMAKQESQWGKRVPVLHGQDCFNYWGFRAQRARMGTGGHTCFDTPQEAVRVVGRRVHELIYEYKRTTPERMLVWKCGSSCAGHSPEGVNAWVSTVSRYRNALRS